MSKRRGKRIVVGYVVSLSGKRGGPWESVVSCVTAQDAMRAVYATQEEAEKNATWWRESGRDAYTQARALPLVRYEVDAVEERLRDAVVEAAERWESAATPLYLVPSAAKELESAVRALRAHREKVGR